MPIVTPQSKTGNRPRLCGPSFDSFPSPEWDASFCMKLTSIVSIRLPCKNRNNSSTAVNNGNRGTGGCKLVKSSGLLRDNIPPIPLNPLFPYETSSLDILCVRHEQRQTPRHQFQPQWTPQAIEHGQDFVQNGLAVEAARLELCAVWCFAALGGSSVEAEEGMERVEAEVEVEVEGIGMGAVVGVGGANVEAEAGAGGVDVEAKVDAEGADVEGAEVEGIDVEAEVEVEECGMGEGVC
ncbi:hypothetical protein F5051DRAFT_434013 [Lentinula edodes]|nr:hypothetical protein F5051DRAFT_434013 [Lentinula edodes]